MLDRAIAEGTAPALQTLIERGTYVRDCVSSFPSVTPCASGSIATGYGPAGHHIPSMNWFHRGEERYVEYGSSFPATRAFGVFRSLYDTVYNMNMSHLSRDVKTVFEHLDDEGLRTACTTYLIYRGRHRHEVGETGFYSRLARAANFRHPVWGPTELFYADLFSSRTTGCRSTLGMPGQRDQHTGCVGAYLVDNDLFDFMLFSLPDNDTWSHKHGPEGQLTSIGVADRAIERIFHAAGGADAFLDDHAVIVMSDHSQTDVLDRINLAGMLADWRVLEPADTLPAEAQIAVCPAARSAMVYVLDPDRRAELTPQIARDLEGKGGIDVVAWREEDEVAVWTPRGALRFSPGGGLRDRRGEQWSIDGDHAALDLTAGAEHVYCDAYPDALSRLWSALDCPGAGDLVISAEPGHEFVDWGGSDHVGGGSHGSLHKGDSEGVLIMCGTGPASADARPQWAIRDVTPLILEHFAVSSDP
ncbi:MAG: alkaline phosphatase family protein [Thermoleophilaceae bacterium]|nr:alkaline phosphatase family protein [Thermoleophilaceae bacterium]